MSTFNIFADSGLTVPAVPLAFAQLAGGAPVDRLVWFGSPAAGKKLQASSDPGADALVLEIFDTDAGSGAPATALKLATSAAGLNTATAGASLALGSTILSGAANAVPVFARADAGSATPVTYTDLQVRVMGALETDA